MLGAIDAVKKDGTGVNAAAAQFGVPPSTLRDRLSGQVVHGTRPGVAPYLAKEEETQLAEYLASTSKVGYGKTRQQVMNIVQRVAKDKGVLKKDKINCGWFWRFRERNPIVSLRQGDSMAAVRFQCTTPEIIDEYYDLLETVLTEHELSDNAAKTKRLL